MFDRETSYRKVAASRTGLSFNQSRAEESLVLIGASQKIVAPAANWDHFWSACCSLDLRSPAGTINGVVMDRL